MTTLMEERLRKCFPTLSDEEVKSAATLTEEAYRYAITVRMQQLEEAYAARDTKLPSALPADIVYADTLHTQKIRGLKTELMDSLDRYEELFDRFSDTDRLSHLIPEWTSKKSFHLGEFARICGPIV